MAKIKINTDKIKNAGEELQSIAKDYNTIVNNVYFIINRLSSDGAWVSDKSNSSVNLFINIVSKDKASMLGLANSINSLGIKLVNYANNMESIADDNF